MADLKVPVICLIGSSRFKGLFQQIAEKMEKRGILPLMMGFWQHTDGIEVTAQDREILNRVDRARIDLAHEVWVVDGKRHRCVVCGRWSESAGIVAWSICCGEVSACKPYVGDDTKREINYALSKLLVVRNLSDNNYEPYLV